MGRYLDLARESTEGGLVSSFSSSSNPKKESNKRYNVKEDTPTKPRIRSSEKSELSEISTQPEVKAALSVVQCIHRLASDECAVCSGYVRWLIADEDRLRRMQGDPEAVRREFWVGGGV